MTTEEMEELRGQYPDYITERQMCEICHISLKTSRYLLKSQIIPNFNTGKKTRQYRIRLEDVIDFQVARDAGIEYKKPSRGYYKSGGTSPARPKQIRIRQPDLSEEEIKTIRAWYEEKMKGWPDVLTCWWVANLLGCKAATVSRWCREEELKSFYEGGRYMIPQEYLLDFLVSPLHRCRNKLVKKEREQEKELEALLRESRDGKGKQEQRTIPAARPGNEHPGKTYSDAEADPGQEGAGQEELTEILKSPKVAALVKALANSL